MTGCKHMALATRNNQEGFMMVACLMLLALITIIGVMSIRTANTDIDISANTQIYNRSFYAAEAGRAFVLNNAILYGSENITPGTPVAFPNPDDPTATEAIIAGGPETYNGEVEYLSSSVPPRGSGYQVGKFRAHTYRMICNGNGPRNAVTRIEAGFYRIGF
jgi:hypothetical protein